MDIDHVWVGGEDGTILFTDDGGATWNKQETGSKNNTLCITARNIDTAWAVGPSQILKTEDQGENWFFQDSPIRPNNTIEGVAAVRE